MAGKKTHEQQLRVIEGRENTKNADESFDAEADLKMSKEQREARRKGQGLRSDVVDLSDRDDRNMVRGEQQESRHHKEKSDD